MGSKLVDGAMNHFWVCNSWTTWREPEMSQSFPPKKRDEHHWNHLRYSSVMLSNLSRKLRNCLNIRGEHLSSHQKNKPSGWSVRGQTFGLIEGQKGGATPMTGDLLEFLDQQKSVWNHGNLSVPLQCQPTRKVTFIRPYYGDEGGKNKSLKKAGISWGGNIFTNKKHIDHSTRAAGKTRWFPSEIIQSTKRVHDFVFLQHHISLEGSPTLKKKTTSCRVQFFW